MNAIFYVLPFFLLLIVIELSAARWMGKKTYRLHDAITSMNIGSLSEIVRTLARLISIGIYGVVVEKVGAFTFDVKSPLVWILAFFMYDFFYYWAHRTGHEVNLIWGAHAVHHNSEDFNLATALRQSSTNQIFYWLFYLPMALLGIPVMVFGITVLISLVYQFWVHTRLVPKLGWFDRYFSSPSNHRVHHGKNDYCIDRNYGATLIIWDRMFGTYAAERDDEPVIYGTITPLESWNPLWANLNIYAELGKNLRQTSGWKNKLMLIFGPPGWTPEGMLPHGPINSVQFETPAPKWQRVYGLTGYAGVTMLTIGWASAFQTLALPMAVMYGLLPLLSAVSLGRLFAGQRLALPVEILRVLILCGALTAGVWFTAVTPAFQLLGAAGGVVSLMLLALMRLENISEPGASLVTPS